MVCSAEIGTGFSIFSLFSAVTGSLISLIGLTLPSGASVSGLGGLPVLGLELLRSWSAGSGLFRLVGTGSGTGTGLERSAPDVVETSDPFELNRTIPPSSVWAKSSVLN